VVALNRSTPRPAVGVLAEAAVVTSGLVEPVPRVTVDAAQLLGLGQLAAEVEAAAAVAAGYSSQYSRISGEARHSRRMVETVVTVETATQTPQPTITLELGLAGPAAAVVRQSSWARLAVLRLRMVVAQALAVRTEAAPNTVQRGRLAELDCRSVS
jgi:hypothetical protein